MADNSEQKKIVVGMTGASGICYAIRLIEVLVKQNWEIHLMVTTNAWRVMQEEEGLAGVGATAPLSEWLDITEDQARRQIVRYHIRDIAAKPASGTFAAQAMIICPASMKTVAGLAHGYSEDLLSRCADCFLKERRPLVVVPRETPLNTIHLENMLKLAQAGAHMVPAMPGFYGRPSTVGELVDFMVAKILNLIDVEHNIELSWEGPGYLPVRKRIR